MRNIFIITSIYILVGFFTQISAQDIHFSQYNASPIIINPAYTGMFDNAEYRISNQYRSQWDAIARKSYLSSIVSFDMPYQEKWGIGSYLINDNSARVYNSFSFVASGAHNITIDDNNQHILTAGIQLGIIYKSTRLDEYLFDNQYSSGAFDSDLPSGEVFEKNGRIMPEINLGVSYQNNQTGKTALPYGGLSFFHLLNPKENLTPADDSRLPIKYVFHGGSKIKISDKIIIDPNFLIMRQRNAMELNFGTQGFFELKETDFNLIGGINYRWNDAIITTFGIFYKSFIYRVSYDFNVSSLREFSSYQGGLEFSIVFIKQDTPSLRFL